MISRPEAMISAPATWLAVSASPRTSDAERGGRHRHQQRHQHDVGGARRGDDAKEQHVGQRRRQHGEAEHGADHRPARRRQQPGLLDSTRPAAASGRSSTAAARRPTPAAACRESAAATAPTARRTGPPPRKQAMPIRLDGCRLTAAGPISTATPASPSRTPATLAPVSGSWPEQARDQHREQRRGGVDHRGEPAGDARLAVEHQREGHDVVEERQDHEAHRQADRPRGRR